MKNLLKPLILLYVLSFTLCISAQNQKEKLFKTTLNEVVNLLKNKDSFGIKKYIDKNTGVFIIYRPGVMDCYSNYESLDFCEQIFPNIKVNPDIKSAPLTYGQLPEYNCENMRWSKIGCYVDTNNIDHLLSSTAENVRKYMEVEISDQIISTFYNLEQNSRYVLIVSPSEGCLAIFLSYINKKWYLTIIDQVAGDCSA